MSISDSLCLLLVFSLFLVGDFIYWNEYSIGFFWRMITDDSAFTSRYACREDSAGDHRWQLIERSTQGRNVKWRPPVKAVGLIVSYINIDICILYAPRLRMKKSITVSKRALWLCDELCSLLL